MKKLTHFTFDTHKSDNESHGILIFFYYYYPYLFTYYSKSVYQFDIESQP